MDSVAQQLSAQVDKHPDELMGVAFCHDYSAIELSVKDGVDLKQLPDVAKILSDNPASRVVIQTTPMSVAELRALRDSVVEADLADGTASAASYAIGTHDSTVVVSSQRGAQDTSLKKLKDVGQSGRVKIRDEKSKGHGTDSRLTDVPALNPGAEITHQDGDWLWFCSLGVPVKVGGVSMILTAGHCTYSSYYSNRGGTHYSIGTVHTSSWGNSHLYGDWKLDRQWTGRVIHPRSVRHCRLRALGLPDNAGAITCGRGWTGAVRRASGQLARPAAARMGPSTPAA